MITGVRLTQLANGEPLLSTAWYYKNLSSVNAVKQRLSDLFDIAQDIGFEFIIDTIKPNLTSNDDLTLLNNGVCGDLWSFSERINMYESLLTRTRLNILMEIEFPTFITDTNWKKYADYLLSLIEQYNWVQYWQIMVTPEIKDSNGNYKCDPINYVRFLKYIYPIIKIRFSGVKIGGPGIFNALIDYIDRGSNPTDWLSAAIGDVYDSSTTEYIDIGQNGFLPFIDFFSIEAKQNVDNRLSYESLPQIIDNLIMDFKLKINKDFLIFSIYQGHSAPVDNLNALREQGYYDLREILNCVKKGVVPFKAQLIDEYFNPNTQTDSDKYHMGLMQYFMGDDSKKPSFNEYKFLLNGLKEFNKVTNTNQVIDNYTNVDIVTLINTTGDKTATVVWPKKFENTTVTLQPHYARQYITSSGEKGNIVNPTQILFNTNTVTGIKFVIIFQTINKNIINIAELETDVDKKLNYTEQTLNQFISLLPSTYNKEIRDVNYYKILRAIALEMADAKITIDKISDNLYLDTASEEAIYNNFGTLINLSKKAEWSYDKYKRLVKGVTKSLLDGPTNQSIVDAVKLFTNFDVSIYELYKNYTHVDAGSLGNVKPQYAFVIEIEKPIDAPAEQMSIYEDANYVINIVKPAHTIHLVLLTLTGNENYKNYYKEKYGKDINQYDGNLYKYTMEANLNNLEGIYGWKSLNYDGQFKTANTDVDSEIFNNNSLTNGALFIGPRYVLYDEYFSSLEYNIFECYNDLFDTIDCYFDLFANETYEEVKEKLNIEFNKIFIEMKFGFSYDNSLQLTSKMLNKFKLAPSTNLSDEMFAHLERFLQEKYSIKSIILNNELESFNRDKYDFSCIEKDDYDVGLFDNISDFIESIYSSIDQFKSEAYITNEINEQEFKEALLNENYEQNILEKMSTEIELYPALEQYRAWTLSDNWYHIHKKYNNIISSVPTDKYFPLPDGDLSEAEDTSNNSPIKVYLNGVLQPSFNYTEVKTFFTTNRIIGIKFEPDILREGDIISILYLSIQQLNVVNFPILDSFTTDIELTNIDVWGVIDKINESLHIYIHYDSDQLDESHIDIVERIKDNYTSFSDLNNGDNYYKHHHDKEDKEKSTFLDVPEFEGSPYLDYVQWNITQNTKTILEYDGQFKTADTLTILNSSKLNLTLLGGTLQEKYEIEMYKIVDGEKVNISREQVNF